MSKKKAKQITAGDIPVHCAHDTIEDTEALVPHPRNPNQHPGAQIKALAQIIKNQGWRQPITVSTRSGFIIKGHGRLEAARVLGTPQVPVDRQDYPDEASEWADMIADNRIAELSDFNLQELSGLLKDMPDVMHELTGYMDYEIAPLLEAVWTPPEGGDDPPEPPDNKKRTVVLNDEQAEALDVARAVLVQRQAMTASDDDGVAVLAVCRAYVGGA